MIEFVMGGFRSEGNGRSRKAFSCGGKRRLPRRGGLLDYRSAGVGSSPGDPAKDVVRRLMAKLTAADCKEFEEQLESCAEAVTGVGGAGSRSHALVVVLPMLPVGSLAAVVSVPLQRNACPSGTGRSLRRPSLAESRAQGPKWRPMQNCQYSEWTSWPSPEDAFSATLLQVFGF
ncbi:unnamed protein product [Symbiodinium sp. KB8]|nr:unnamed protein product [Symbiodinium sp. KB8]